MWKYQDLARSLGIEKTLTVKDFDAFFGQIEEMRTDEPKMVELFFDKMDYPPLLKQISDKLEEANREG